MRTRLFLRTTEFLWQEGHTAHATEAEAEQETLMILGIYRRFAEEWMAMPVLTGRKTESERFAGALRTYAIEALMQDNRALQAGTSHNLGQNFAKAFDVTFQTAEGGLDHVWSTSWGVSTRLIGGLIMTHGDDVGLVCPPRLAQYQVVIVPIYKTDEERVAVLRSGRAPPATLRPPASGSTLDVRDGLKPGAKYYEWETRGVPFRLELGPRDLAADRSCWRGAPGARSRSRWRASATGCTRRWTRCSRRCSTRRVARREAGSIRGASATSWSRPMNGPMGFVYGGWCGDATCEAEIKEQTKATIRVLPDEEFRSDPAPTRCLWCNRDAVTEAVWAKAY